MSETQVREASSGDGIILPFYICCDVSMSMAADMTILNDSVRDLIRAAAADEVVSDVALIAVHKFSDSAAEVIPLARPGGAIEMPVNLREEGATNYGAAFQLLRNSIDRDIRKVHADSPGAEIYRSVVFFLTDGEPTDGHWFESFKSNLTYDPDSGQGFKYHPLFIPFGIRDAKQSVLERLAFPPGKSQWFMSNTTSVEDALKAMVKVMLKTVMTAGKTPPGQDVQVPRIVRDVAAEANIQTGESKFTDKYEFPPTDV